MSKIEQLLDNSLYIIQTAREMNAIVDEWPNVMISGLSGSGKTAITKQWAEDAGIMLVPYDLSRDVTVIYEEDAGGILRPKKAKDPVSVAKQLIFSALAKYQDGKDFILLLDDYHRATKENIEAINYTIDTHQIMDPVTGETIKLDNLLFTVAIRTIGLQDL